MNKIINYLKSFDFFGAPLVQQIDTEQSIFKSILGGICTLLIFSSSISYTVWVLYQWQTNQFSPKISSSVYVSDFQLLDMNYDVIKMHFWKLQQDYIDPFEQKVLIAMVMYTENYTFSEQHILNLSNQTAYDGNKYIIPKMKLGFSNIDGILMTTSEMYIQIVKCSPDLLEEGQQCASEEITQQFFSQQLNTIVVQIEYRQLNSKDGTIQSGIQEFLIQIEQPTCYTLNTYLQSNFYEIKNSFLFGQPSYYEFVNGALIQPQTNSIEYCKLAYGYETYSLLYVVMKGNQLKTIFEYPNAGDLFANIGSIVSILFMVRHIIVFFNAQFLNEKIIHDLISFYYPQFSILKIQKNWKREIIKVSYQDEILNLVEFKRFYFQIQKKMETKLTFINILYEISRIYFLIRSKTRKEEIKKCHLVGLKLEHLQLNRIMLAPMTSQCSTQRDVDEQTLEEEDINILSITERNKQMKFGIPDEECDLVNFFDINKIKI